MNSFTLDFRLHTNGQNRLCRGNPRCTRTYASERRRRVILFRCAATGNLRVEPLAVASWLHTTDAVFPQALKVKTLLEGSPCSEKQKKTKKLTWNCCTSGRLVSFAATMPVRMIWMERGRHRWRPAISESAPSNHVIDDRKYSSSSSPSVLSRSFHQPEQASRHGYERTAPVNTAEQATARAAATTRTETKMAREDGGRGTRNISRQRRPTCRCYCCCR